MSFTKKQLYLDDNWGVFLGAFSDNKMHKHYAVQLSMGLADQVVITSEEGKKYERDTVLIKSNIPHQLECPSDQLLFLFNPVSVLGCFFNENLPHAIGKPDLSELKTIRDELVSQQKGFQWLIGRLKTYFDSLTCACESQEHLIDDRIGKALVYLEGNKHRVVSLGEISSHCCLSQDRFLHLFRQETGITYRRARLWYRISQSLSSLGKYSITEIAHKFGFTDSAHYSRTFKENFGFTPVLLAKD